VRINTLPDGWTRVKFGSVVRNVNETSRNLESDGIDRVVGLDHLEPGSLTLVRWDNITDLPDGTTFTRKFKSGHVLFGKRRAYQRKVAVPDFHGVCSGDILVFEPADERLLTEFLPYLVQSDSFFDHALGTSAGSLSPRTKWAELAKYEFALPPLDEQQRIVEVIAAVDKHISCLAKQVDVACIARTAVLSELMSAGGDDWTDSTLGDVVTLEYGKPLKAEDRDGEGFPVFGSAGEVGFHSKPLVSTAPVIIVGRKGTAGAVWWSDIPCSVIDTAYFVVPRVEIDIRFLYFALERIDLPSMNAQTGVPGLNRERAYSLRLCIPPLAEQQRIVENVSSLNDVIQSAENAVVATKSLRSGLLTVLLAGGEL
jgi:type I restriction enzyme S subunit